MTQMQVAEPGLVELRRSALHSLTTLVAGLACASLWLVAIFPQSAGLGPFAIACALGATWALARSLESSGERLSAVLLVSGLLATTVLAVHLYPRSLLVLGLAAVVTIASVLLGWRLGLVAAAAACAVVLRGSGDLVTPDAAHATLVLVVGAFALSVVLWRPVETLLAWSWASTDLAGQKTEEAREHRARLVVANRSLNEAYLRLEQIGRDLDAARRTAEEARKVKTDFATNISHELRTPLNLIIGFAEMMLFSPRALAIGGLSEAVRGDVEAIYRNARHLSDLVDDVLDLSQIEAHRMGLAREPSVLAEIVDEAVAAIATMYREKGLTLSARIDPGLPVLIVDRTRIRQVLINLLTNAARFTSQGCVSIEAGYDEHQVVVAVVDSGIGISAQNLSGVFDAFYRIAPEGSLRHSGLGLAICKRFVELHGGNIWVTSRPKEGSVFSFSIPRTDNVMSWPAERAWDEVSVALHREPHSTTIALVDDDPRALRVLQRYLDGYQVVPIADQQANGDRTVDPIRALITTRVDTPLSDSLPWPPEDSGRASIPLVTFPLQTAVNMADHLQVAAYLHKPVSRQQIHAALDRVGGSIRHVLVVDDDPDMVRLLSQMLQAELPRADVSKAHNGLQALELLRASPRDVVILDLLMPQLDGYEVLDRMRQDPRLAGIPVLVVTARGADEETSTVSRLEITRSGGLSIGEAIRCLQTSLDVLLAGHRTALVKRGEQLGARDGFDEHAGGAESLRKG